MSEDAVGLEDLVAGADDRMRVAGLCLVERASETVPLLEIATVWTLDVCLSAMSRIAVCLLNDETVCLLLVTSDQFSVRRVGVAGEASDSDTMAILSRQRSE